ncbi:hypothetical protein Z046_33295 [Pseudomonas aeruginosa VRFPA09]|nr:hypothetical protein Z046_33295 [Pseudomonas aeruginosa VRFPA09]
MGVISLFRKFIQGLSKRLDQRAQITLTRFDVQQYGQGLGSLRGQHERGAAVGFRI